MKIELITQENYDILIDIYNNFPELSLQNKGYEGIDRDKLTPEVIEKDKVVNDILRKSIYGFSSFQNFRKNVRDNAPEIRFQYNYNYDGNGLSFIGVGYILIDELLNGFKEKDNEKS